MIFKITSIAIRNNSNNSSVDEGLPPKNGQYTSHHALQGYTSVHRKKLLVIQLFIYYIGCVKPIHTNPTKRVAFSAYLNHSQTFNNGVVVKFNQVQLNQGKAYNPSNGVFTCPKSGIYQITWFFLCQNPKRPGSVVWLQMDVNEKPYAYAGVPLDEIHNPGFRSHLVELKRGDRVTIVAHGTNMMVYGNSNRHTGFSALYVSAWSKTDEINIITGFCFFHIVKLHCAIYTV